MIKYCSQEMTKGLIKNGVIDEKEYKIYEYGFETFLASLINIVTVLIIGAISGRFIHTLLFLITYSSVRQFSGGYHAKNHIRCFITFMAIYISTLVFSAYIGVSKNNFIIVVSLIVSLVIIFQLAPLEHHNNPLNKFEKVRYRNITRGLSAALGIIALVGLFAACLYEYSLYIAFALLWVGIMLIGGYRKEANK